MSSLRRRGIPNSAGEEALAGIIAAHSFALEGTYMTSSAALSRGLRLPAEWYANFGCACGWSGPRTHTFQTERGAVVYATDFHRRHVDDVEGRLV